MNKAYKVESTCNIAITTMIPTTSKYVTILPGINIIDVPFSEIFGGNPDKKIEKLIKNYPQYLKLVDEVEVKLVDEKAEVELTIEFLKAQDEEYIDNLAKEKNISFGRVRNLQGKIDVIIEKLGLLMV